LDDPVEIHREEAKYQQQKFSNNEETALSTNKITLNFGYNYMII